MYKTTTTTTTSLHLLSRLPIRSTPTSPPTPTFLNHLHPTAAAAASDPARQRALALCRSRKFEEAVAFLFGLRSSTTDAVSILDLLARSPPALYTSLLRLCLNNAATVDAKRVHARARASGFAPGTLLSNRLIDLFARSGFPADARRVFEEMTRRDLCSYNTLISAYVRSGEVEEARGVFDRIPGGRRDSFSWSSMISGYVRHGRAVEALGLYRKMQKDSSGLRYSRFVLSCAISAAMAISSLRHGREIHGCIVRARLDCDGVVWSTLMDLYAKCGRIDEARCIFDQTPVRDVVSWTSMMGWYFESGMMECGFLLFSSMLQCRVVPNEYTYAGVLTACSWQLMENMGMQIHGHLYKTGLAGSSFACAALIDMYSKCGSVENAEYVFKSMMMPDLVSWTSIISCYAQNGWPERALQYFERMQECGLRPDEVVFVGVLCACSHAGLIEKGLQIFYSIEREYGLLCTSDHYACIVDLLSRAGQFEEARKIIGQMPCEPSKYLWSSLLNGCKIHGNTEYARVAAEALFETDPGNSATYVTLANIYAKAGRWKDVWQVRKMMCTKGVKKNPGSSWIEVGRKIHHFLASDDSHPMSRDIFLELEKLCGKMKEHGYVPETDFVLHDFEEEEDKAQHLSHHSEKLAVAFGLIATYPGTPIKIYKNLRTCGDCHTALKFISRISQREIIMRDSSRFHHFKNGTCTCQDYW